MKNQETMRTARCDLLQAVDELSTIRDLLRCQYFNLRTLDRMLTQTLEVPHTWDDTLNYSAMLADEVERLLDRLTEEIDNVDRARKEFTR